MEEIILNVHMHTFYSDGHVTHAQIAAAALKTGVDVVIVTDHNVYVQGPEGYYRDGDRQALLLVGEEIHDQARQPQKNHLLAFGHGRELAPLAGDLPRLLESIRAAGGLSFLAHPVDPAAPAVGEDDLSWEDWTINNFTGIELWNAMSEFKSLLKSKLHAIYYAFNPNRIARGPFPAVLKLWDELLAGGRRVAAICGSDAHALPARLGPLKRVLFPFEYHFKTVNNHLLVDSALTGDIDADRKLIFEAMRRGRCFIGYDLPAPTHGFRFSAQGYEQTAAMGDEINPARGITFQIRLPQNAACRLICDGEVVQSWNNQQYAMYVTSQPGAYRVEVSLDYLGRSRGWIYSNPIYVRS